jgi:hypothetical protein
MGKITAEIPFNVEGMSGGPIFGIFDHPTEVYYVVVAMQNSWHETTDSQVSKAIVS